MFDYFLLTCGDDWLVIYILAVTDDYLNRSKYSSCIKCGDLN
jgi:hypothetical protein